MNSAEAIGWALEAQQRPGDADEQLVVAVPGGHLLHEQRRLLDGKAIEFAREGIPGQMGRGLVSRVAAARGLGQGGLGARYVSASPGLGGL